MNHKHIMVMLEDYAYSGMYDIQEVINDLEDYCDSLPDGDSHYPRCIANKETKE